MENSCFWDWELGPNLRLDPSKYYRMHRYVGIQLTFVMLWWCGTNVPNIYIFIHNKTTLTICIAQAFKEKIIIIKKYKNSNWGGGIVGISISRLDLMMLWCSSSLRKDTCKQEREEKCSAKQSQIVCYLKSVTYLASFIKCHKNIV